MKLSFFTFTTTLTLLLSTNIYAAHCEIKSNAGNNIHLLFDTLPGTPIPINADFYVDNVKKNINKIKTLSEALNLFKNNSCIKNDFTCEFAGVESDGENSDITQIRIASNLVLPTRNVVQDLNALTESGYCTKPQAINCLYDDNFNVELNLTPITSPNETNFKSAFELYDSLVDSNICTPRLNERNKNKRQNCEINSTGITLNSKKYSTKSNENTLKSLNYLTSRKWCQFDRTQECSINRNHELVIGGNVFRSHNTSSIIQDFAFLTRNNLCRSKEKYNCELSDNIQTGSLGSPMLLTLNKTKDSKKNINLEFGYKPNYKPEAYINSMIEAVNSLANNKTCMFKKIPCKLTIQRLEESNSSSPDSQTAKDIYTRIQDNPNICSDANTNKIQKTHPTEFKQEYMGGAATE